jgi:ABC-type glycerol-3-phosphate transport system substrate-binding protein
MSFASAALCAPIKLSLWQGFKFSEVSMLRSNVDDFTRDWNAHHPDQPLTISIDQVPFDEMVRKIKSAAPARMLPDLVFVDANKMVPLAYGGAALALDTVPDAPTTDIQTLRQRYVPGAFDTNIVHFKGASHLYGIPAQTTTLALFWNKRMFKAHSQELKAAGLADDRAPRDWDELIKVGRILTNSAKGEFGFGMNNSLWFTMPFLNQYKVELAVRNSVDGSLHSGLLIAPLARERAFHAINRKVNLYLRDKVEGGAWRDGNLNPDQGFQNEKYAMVLTGPWMIENFRSSGLDFGVALIPRVPIQEAKELQLLPQDPNGSSGEEKLSAGNIGGQNLVVTSTCKNANAAIAFALYFTSEPAQRRWAEELGQIPVLLKAQENLNLSKFPEVPTFIEQVRLAKPLPALPFGGTLETEIFNPEINLVLQGQQSAETAIKKIEAAITERILKPVNEAEAAGK